jgi:hypothetical protein
MKAACCGREETVRLLLDKGAAVDAAKKEGATALLPMVLAARRWCACSWKWGRQWTQKIKAV